MTQDLDFLSASLDDMTEIAAMAWQSSPQECLHLLHRFQAVNDTFLLFAQAYQHAASLAAERQPSEPAGPPDELRHHGQQHPLVAALP
jgi:hypothetical protein